VREEIDCLAWAARSDSITPDLEVGVRVGWGLNDQSARFFVNAGVGLRF
jgi:hypothetical protein